jgi:hypothetical protein
VQGGKRKKNNKHGKGSGTDGCAVQVKILNAERKLYFSEIQM